MSGKLYTFSDNFRAHKALIAAQYSGVQLTVPSDFVFGETNKSDGFLKKFPFGKVPAYEGADGTCLFESNAIAWHVATDQLRGGGADGDCRGQVLQWMSFADNELLPAVCSWTFPLQGIVPLKDDSQHCLQQARDHLASLLHPLNGLLLTRTYLVGERISLADIAVCCTLVPAFRLALDPQYRKSFPNVVRWFTTMVNQPQVKAVIGEMKLCDKSAAPAADKQHKKRDNVKQKKEKNKSKPPSEDTGAKKVATSDNTARPKPAQLFASVSESSFVMDDFKRFYSNNDGDKSVPFFWEHFDKKNFSIWFCEYNFPESLGQVFMTTNLLNGMYQRLDTLRKHAFASMLVFGENGNSSLSGVWVWPGQDLVFELCDDWTVDYESYTWRKLDPEAPDTKPIVDSYLQWLGEDSKGRAVNQGKIFK